MISIIVPVYGVEKFLPKCIESLISQTYKDIEIILIDDGSPDGCGAICDDFAAKDNRITVIHQPNAGVSAARNAGLEIAKGEYIGFCDPDDFVSQEMFDDMKQAMESFCADLAVCGYNYYSEEYERDETRPYHVRPNELLKADQFCGMLSDMPPTGRCGVVNKLFLRSKIGNKRFDVNLHSAEDLAFVIDYLSEIKYAVFVHKPHYSNLVRQGSATHGGLSIDRLRDSFAVHDKMYTTSVTLHPQLRDHSLAFLLDVCFLKYNEVKARTGVDPKVKAQCLAEMRKYLRPRVLEAINDKEIYWKTRISYLKIWIKK